MAWPQFRSLGKLAGIRIIAGYQLDRGTQGFTALFPRSPQGLARLNRMAGSLYDRERSESVPWPDFPWSQAVELLDHDPEGVEDISLVSDCRQVLDDYQARVPGQAFLALVYGRPYHDSVQWAQGRGLSVVPLVDGRWIHSGHRDRRRLMRSIDRRIHMDQLDEADYGDEQRLVTPQEFFSAYPSLPHVRGNLESFAHGLPSLDDLYPQRWVFPPFESLSEPDAHGLLRRRCLEAVDRRYGSGSAVPRNQVLERLDYELTLIRAKGFSSYFLVVQDIVSQLPRTCGRGSAASSVVSFLLGITHVEPIANGLFFERFLNHGRVDPPDIDVDFPWDERSSVLEYVFERYRGHSAFVADHITFAPRLVLREAAQALGYGVAEVDQFARLWRTGGRDQLPKNLTDAMEQIRGLPRHLGTHPGGVVITPLPMEYYAPVVTSNLGWPLLPWEKDGTEDMGLVKIDLLGNRSLGVLRDSIALVNARHGTVYTWEDDDAIRDPETVAMVERGKTLGVFYVESPATRQLLSKMGRGDFAHLVVASSIIRPAANRFINLYVQRLRGASYEPLDPRLQEVLRETHGIMVYQEDVARVAIALAGFDAAEADRLRKLLSRKDKAQRLPAMAERFYDGCRSQGVQGSIAEKVWEMILSFDGYSFCKSHSASYARVSFRLAQFKRLYPLEFFVSVLNNGGGFYAAQTYLNEIRRLGYPIVGPQLQRSQIGFTIEGPRGAERVRLGLERIDQLGPKRASELLKIGDQEGPMDLHGFLAKFRPGPGELRALVRSGCLDPLVPGMSRPAIFWLASGRGRAQTGSGELFGQNQGVPPVLKDYSSSAQLYDELRFTGLLYSMHPLDLLGGPLEPVGSIEPIDSRLLGQYLGREVRIQGLLVTGKEVYTVKREPMSFLSFEDSFGIFETVAFPAVYKRFLSLLDGNLVFVLQGRVQEELGALSIHLTHVTPLIDRYSEEGRLLSNASLFSST